MKLRSEITHATLRTSVRHLMLCLVLCQSGFYCYSQGGITRQHFKNIDPFLSLIFSREALCCIAYLRRTLLYGYDIREVIPPLCYACENGKVEVVEYLIKLRAHIKIQDKVNDES